MKCLAHKFQNCWKFNINEQDIIDDLSMKIVLIPTTVQPHYSMPHYNTNLDITQLCLGFPIVLLQITPYNTVSLIT